MKARARFYKGSMRGGSPEDVGKILSSALRRNGIDEELAKYRFVSHWEEIVGPVVAKKTRPEYLRKGSLVIRVADSTWAQELSFERHIILEKLKVFLGQNQVVKDIFFVVGEV